MVKWKNTACGNVINRVQQFSVLGLLLFLIYINDIDFDLCLKLCKVADNTKIGHAVPTEEEVQILRNDLTNLAKWAIDWQMLFNVGKIGANNNLCAYNVNNATVKTVGVKIDLGVIINKDGK